MAVLWTNIQEHTLFIFAKELLIDFWPAVVRTIPETFNTLVEPQSKALKQDSFDNAQSQIRADDYL